MKQAKTIRVDSVMRMLNDVESARDAALATADAWKRRADNAHEALFVVAAELQKVRAYLRKLKAKGKRK